MIQGSSTLAIILSLLFLSSSVQIKTDAVRHLTTNRGEKEITFVEPVQIFSGIESELQVMIDYSKVIDPKATRVEFMILFCLNDIYFQPSKEINFVRV